MYTYSLWLQLTSEFNKLYDGILQNLFPDIIPEKISSTDPHCVPPPIMLCTKVIFTLLKGHFQELQISRPPCFPYFLTASEHCGTSAGWICTVLNACVCRVLGIPRLGIENSRQESSSSLIPSPSQLFNVSRRKVGGSGRLSHVRNITAASFNEHGRDNCWNAANGGSNCHD